MQKCLIDWLNEKPSAFVGTMIMVFTAEITCALGLLVAWLLGRHR